MTELMATAAQGPDGPVITLAGEADLETIPQLRGVIARQIDEGIRHLTLDLAGLRFLDSGSLQVLLRAARALQERGGRLTLARPGEAVARILAITGADQLLDVQAGSPA